MAKVLIQFLLEQLLRQVFHGLFLVLRTIQQDIHKVFILQIVRMKLFYMTRLEIKLMNIAGNNRNVGHGWEVVEKYISAHNTYVYYI